MLSAALLHPPAFLEARETGLEGPHFYADRHFRVWTAIRELADSGKPYDTVTVARHLQQCQRLSQIGGPGELAKLTEATPAVANVAEHARIITDLWRRRRAIETCHKLAAEGYTTQDPESWMARIREQAEQVTQARSKGGAFQIASFDEAWGPMPPVNFICEGLDLAPGPVNIFAGYGFSGKTTALQSMAISVAMGLDIWGSYRCRQGRVLHIDYEQGKLTYRKYQRLARAFGVAFTDLSERLDIVTMPKAPDGYLDSRVGMAEFAQLCEGYDLVIVDSMRASALSIDENSSEVRVLLDQLTRVSVDTDATIALIHHATKPSKDRGGGKKFTIRGSGGIFDAGGSIFVFEGTKQGIVVTQEKAKNSGVNGPEFCLEITDVPDEAGNMRAGLSVMATRRVEDAGEAAGRADREARWEADLDLVEAAIRENPGMSKRRLRGLTPLRNTRLSDVVEELVELGRIERGNGDRGGASYSVSKQAL